MERINGYLKKIESLQFAMKLIHPNQWNIQEPIKVGVADARVWVAWSGINGLGSKGY